MSHQSHHKKSGGSLLLIVLGLAAVAALTASVFYIDAKLEQRRKTRQASAVATTNITFPEGRTVRQYGALLEENGVCGAEEFYAAMRDNDYTQTYAFLPDNAVLQQRDYPLEGYLYPDTYSFYVPESADSVIKRFLNNFQAKVPDELVTYANANGEGFRNIDMSFDPAVVLASIIERESPTDNERAKIAACFYNRMENPSASGTGGKLQSDATRYYPYVIGTAPEGFVSEYNTYNFAGLPKGPICSPSLSSLRAAVYPDTTCKAYFFYNDINDKHYYADTYEQHLANIRYCKEHGLAG
jgi:UPF0755 protein